MVCTGHVLGALSGVRAEQAADGAVPSSSEPRGCWRRGAASPVVQAGERRGLFLRDAAPPHCWIGPWQGGQEASVRLGPRERAGGEGPGESSPSWSGHGCLQGRGSGPADGPSVCLCLLDQQGTVRTQDEGCESGDSPSRPSDIAMCWASPQALTSLSRAVPAVGSCDTGSVSPGCSAPLRPCTLRGLACTPGCVSSRPGSLHSAWWGQSGGLSPTWSSTCQRALWDLGHRPSGACSCGHRRPSPGSAPRAA